MRTAVTIFRKELLDTLRDRRTLIMMLLVPILLFPVLISISVKMTSSQVKKAESKVLRVGLLTNENATLLRDSLLARSDLEVSEGVSFERARELVRSDSLDAALVVDEAFDARIATNRPGTVQLLHKSSEDYSAAQRRLRDLLSWFEKRLLSERFDRLGLDDDITRGVDIQTVDIATRQERFGKVVGGFLPYIFVLFCFLGSMYPAIDLGAGEKERGTLETLLTSPATRMQILVGKFGVIVLTGLTSAVVSVLGLYVGVRQAVNLPPAIMDVISGMLQVSSLLMVIGLLIPLSVFFAALLLAFSFFAKSFKEAQSIISPLTIVIIVPVFIGLIPGMELSATTALVPVLNVSLAAREIFSGTISFALLAEVYASLVALAVLALIGCAKWVNREETIFRSS